MGTLITLKADVYNDSLPVLLPDGSTSEYYIGRMINKMNEFGFAPNTVEKNAIATFIADGKAKGWIDYIKYFLPFIGDADHYKAAAVPLIDKLYDYSVFENPVTSATPSQAFTYKDNRIAGLGSTDSSTANRVMLLPLKVADMNGGLTVIMTVNIPTSSASSKELFTIANSSIETQYYVATNLNVNKLNFTDKNENTFLLNVTTGGIGEQNLAAAYFTENGNQTYYRFHQPINGEANVYKSTTTSELALPFVDTECIFRLGGRNNPNASVLALFRSFAVFDPAIPTNQMKQYSTAVFALNTALGRYSE